MQWPVLIGQQLPAAKLLSSEFPELTDQGIRKGVKIDLELAFYNEN